MITIIVMTFKRQVLSQLLIKTKWKIREKSFENNFVEHNKCNTYSSGPELGGHTCLNVLAYGCCPLS